MSNNIKFRSSSTPMVMSPGNNLRNYLCAWVPALSEDDLSVFLIHNTDMSLQFAAN